MRHHSQATTQLPAPSPLLVSICSVGTVFNTVAQLSVLHIDNTVSLPVPEQMVLFKNNQLLFFVAQSYMGKKN